MLTYSLQHGKEGQALVEVARLQIPPGPLRAHYVKATVRVRRYASGAHAVFHRPRCIGRYDASEHLLEELNKRAA